MRAVILAAGEGKRLRPHFGGPKPLTPLLGLSLIERNLFSLRECGIKTVIIITGYKADEIEKRLGDGSRYGIKITYVHNPDWQLGNGMSAHSFSREYRGGEKFILMMSDHIFQQNILNAFVQRARDLQEGEVLLAVDTALEKVFDLEECTKVKVEEERALLLGKELEDFNAVDCGLFAASSSLLEALGEAIAQSRYTLTDAVNILAARGQVKVYPIEGSWVDVDDLASYRYAERMLLRALIPAKDGAVSRFLNRRFSLAITKALASTCITPNQITFLSLVTALASAVAFATAHPALGGLLAQASSIIDGVDGELARLKFLKSNYGGLFDAILDRYADAFIVLGMAYAWYSVSRGPLVLLVSAAALAGLPMSMLFKEKFRVLTGKPFLPLIHDGIFRYLPANRDGRLFLIMLGGIFNLIPATLGFLAAVTHLQVVARLYRARELM